MSKFVTVKEVKELIEPVKYPTANNNLIELGIVQDIAVVDNRAVIVFALPFPDFSLTGKLINSVKEPLEEKGISVEIKTKIMTLEQVQHFLVTEREDWFSLG